MANFETIFGALQYWADRTPEAPAILAPNRNPVTYRSLWIQLQKTLTVFRVLDIKADDPVIISLLQGPEMAIASLIVACGAVAVPVNPKSTVREIDNLIQRTNPKAMLVQKGLDSGAKEAATRHGLFIIELKYSSDKSSCLFDYDIICENDNQTFVGFSSQKDLAYLLTTSGTTARPKIVCLSHKNACAAAGNTLAALGLRPQDRCLNMAMLYHAHGLIAGVLATIMSGGSVVCPKESDPIQFFALMNFFSPTWYTAVPAMHQAILKHVPSYSHVVGAHQLRFIRSASAYLHNNVRESLEKVFNTVVTESYGLSEAPQLTNTPISHKGRKIGSLGIAGSTEVRIMGEGGRFLKPLEAGEIVARGPAVMAGYLSDDENNSAVFHNGWLRTGDLGYVDTDGHLYMNGRIKDQINRGGEKISPQEIDSILLENPNIIQAVAFGIPHPELGEDVVASVVLKPGCNTTAYEIRRKLSYKIEENKIPSRIYIVSELPSTFTGKTLRREMAKQIQLSYRNVKYTPPRNEIERMLVKIWEDTLEISPIGVDDDFFELGGYSLAAVSIFAKISDAFFNAKGTETAKNMEDKSNIGPTILWEAPTIREIGEYISGHKRYKSIDRTLIEIQRGDGLNPFFMLTGDWYGMGYYIKNLARRINPRQPIYALMPHNVTIPDSPKTIESMADDFLAIIKRSQPKGPYILGGYSHAGLVAFEVAKRIQEGGGKVLLLVIDSYILNPRYKYLLRFINTIGSIFNLSKENIFEAYRDWKFRIENFRELKIKGGKELFKFYIQKTLYSNPIKISQTEKMDNPIMIGYFRAIDKYIPTGKYNGCITVLSTMDGIAKTMGDSTLGWCKVCDRVNVIDIPGGHFDWVRKHLDLVAESIESLIGENTGYYMRNNCKKTN